MPLSIRIKIVKCRCHGLVIIMKLEAWGKWGGRWGQIKFKNQMLLSKTVAIESNSNLQFVIVAFELLKKKTLSGTTAFAKHTSLVEKLNSSFIFSHKHYFGLKLHKNTDET